MTSIVILGASSFIAKALINAGPYQLPIKAVARIIPVDQECYKKVEWLQADLLNPLSLDKVFAEGDLVINLVYMQGSSSDQNQQVVENLIQACIKSKVARLVHCSTALVVGATTVSDISESTPCLPLTDYEVTKYEIEKFILSGSHNALDVAVLRPTAVVGVGSKNLVKLSDQLINSSKITNYFRSSLFGNRPMHLVPVQMVSEALVHLIFSPNPLSKQVYIVAADSDADNNFKKVEGLLRKALGMEQRKIPLLPLPQCFLRSLLRLLGRTDFRLSRNYRTDKLKSTGFQTESSVGGAVMSFGASIKNSKLKD
jgi:nucleoside-diphosphate-sugar epimerase